jgi:glyoxylase-like metal-dependent hydrolase (beta-lactamase superfamily II)
MEGTGREITPGLHRIEAPMGERFVACYVIVGDDAAVLFDTGVATTPEESILPYCASAGIDLERIRWAVVSHCDVDHMGGDAAVKGSLPSAALLAHASDARLIEDVEAIIEERYREFRDDHGIDIDSGMIDWCRANAVAAPVDIRIEAATWLDLGGRRVQVLPTPGHSAGSVSIWDPTARAVLSSDAVLGESLHFADGRPAFPPTYRNPTPYLVTIAAIEALRPDWLLTAHEPVMRGAESAAFLARSRDFATTLSASALQELADAGEGLTTLALIERLAPQLGSWDPAVWMFLANELVGHLEELSSTGAVEARHGPPTTWRSTGRMNA